MPYSKISPEFEITEEKWVVSVINTVVGYKGIIGGHAAILVEGLDKDPLSIHAKPFIGQYDIAAPGQDEDCINPKGYITKIKCFENEENRRDYEDMNYPKKSYFVSPLAAKRMIESIKKDRVRTEQAMENWQRQTRNESKNEEEKEPFLLNQEGLPIEPMKFQRLGKHHPFVQLFGDEEAGNNCAGWCFEKLSVAGINVRGLPKPPKPSCLIL